MIARALAVLGVLALFPLQAWLEQVKPPKPDLAQVLPPPAILSILASGHRETAADLLEIKAVTWALSTLNPGVEFSDADRDHLFLLYRGILALDPQDVDAARRGSVLLGAFGWRADASAALLLLARGEEAEVAGRRYRPRGAASPRHPNYWRLFFEEGSIYLSMRANEIQREADRLAWIRRAGAAWVAAGEAGGPATLFEVGERLSRRGLDQAGLLQREFELWQQRYEGAPEEAKPELAERVKALHTRLQAAALDRVVRGLARRGRVVADLSELRGHLPPESLEATFGSLRLFRGGVVAPEAEAHLQRLQLESLVGVWRERNPGRPVTLRALGWLLPPVAAPLDEDPLFCDLGWAPAPALDPAGGAASPKPPETWRELGFEPAEPRGARPLPYLSYRLTSSRVEVAVRPGYW